MLEKYNPWHPITDTVDLKHLGKLAEEANELGSAAARCIIQGVYEKEPVTGKVNKTWLEEEIADVLANIELVQKRFDLDIRFIIERKWNKVERLQTWHAMA